MGVKLREKPLANGTVSLYLDIWHNQKRWTEFLNIHVNKKKPTPEDTENRKLALKIERKRGHELALKVHNFIDPKEKRKDFIKYYEDFIKTKAPCYHRSATLFQLRRFTCNKPVPIASLTTEFMKEFEVFLLKTIKATTAMTYLKDVNSALNNLVRTRILEFNPWHNVPLNDRLKVIEPLRTCWTIHELQLLVNTECNIEPQFKQVYLFSCFTGLRWSDVNGLQWTNVIQDNSGEWFIRFQQQKTDSPEYLPLSGQAIEILQARKIEQEGTNEIFVFPKVKETNLKTKPVQCRVNNALKKWAKATGKLDYKVMKFHTSRHSFATNLLEATNGDIYTVSKLLGHKSIQMTMIYAKVRDKMKQAAVRSLPKINFNPAPNQTTIGR
jgi:integrase